jgi:hypothetical protein
MCNEVKTIQEDLGKLKGDLHRYMAVFNSAVTGKITPQSYDDVVHTAFTSRAELFKSAKMFLGLIARFTEITGEQPTGVDGFLQDCEQLQEIETEQEIERELYDVGKKVS